MHEISDVDSLKNSLSYVDIQADIEFVFTLPCDGFIANMKIRLKSSSHNKELSDYVNIKLDKFWSQSI